MAKSKKEGISELFYNNPTRHWHFSDIVRTAKVSERAGSVWLRKLESENIIEHIKPKLKMPYFIARTESPEYRLSKRMHIHQKLFETGFFNHLYSIEDAKTIIIFGSFAKDEWDSDSDIDVFIYGNSKGLEKYKYEKLLKREIQVFECKDKSELSKFHQGLMQNILSGEIIKGDLNFAKVKVYAR